MIPERSSEIKDLVAQIRSTNEAIPNEASLLAEYDTGKIEECFEKTQEILRKHTDVLRKSDSKLSFSVIIDAPDLLGSFNSLYQSYQNIKHIAQDRFSPSSRAAKDNIVLLTYRLKDEAAAFNPARKNSSVNNYEIAEWIICNGLNETQIPQFAEELLSMKEFTDSSSSQLFSNNTLELKQILGLLLQIPEDQRDEVFQSIMQLIKHGKNRTEIKMFLTSAIRLPKDERVQILNLALQVVGEKTDINTIDRLLIQLPQIEESERQEVISIVQQLFEEKDNTRQNLWKVNLIEIAIIPERSQAFELAKKLFRPTFTLDEKIDLLMAIGNIPATERDQVLFSKQEELSKAESGYEIIKILNSESPGK